MKQNTGYYFFYLITSLFMFKLGMNSFPSLVEF